MWFTILIKILTVLPFLSFKGSTHAYVVKTYMAHSKYSTFLFLEDNYSNSAKSVAQILSLNLDILFFFWIFLITGLCNSSANCSFILLILFSYKTYKPYLLMLFDIMRKLLGLFLQNTLATILKVGNGWEVIENHNKTELLLLGCFHNQGPKVGTFLAEG